MSSPATAASFKVGVSTISQVANASFALSCNPIDVTSIGSAYREHVKGLVNGTATVQLFYDHASHSGIAANFSTGTLLNEAEIIWESGYSVKGKALIESFSMDIAPNGVAQATLGLLFTGNSMTITP